MFDVFVVISVLRDFVGAISAVGAMVSPSDPSPRSAVGVNAVAASSFVVTTNWTLDSRHSPIPRWLTFELRGAAHRGFYGDMASNLRPI